VSRSIAAILVGFILSTPVAHAAEGDRPIRLRSETVRLSRQTPSAEQAATPGRGPRIIQLRDTLTAEQQTRLQEAGVELLTYLPENAYLARVPSDKAGAVRDLSFVEAVAPLRASWKLAPEVTGLRAALARGADPQDLAAVRRPGVPSVAPRDVALVRSGRVPLAVATVRGADGVAAAVALRGIPGVEVRSHVPLSGGAVLDVIAPLERLEALAALPEVQFVEPAPRPTLRNSMTVTTIQSDTNTQTPVWDRGLHGEGEVLGLIDGPMTTTHCMFTDTEPIGPTHRKLVAWRVSVPFTLNTHGSHVAGTLAGDAGVIGAYDLNDGVAFASRISFSNYFAVEADPPTLQARLLDAHNDGARIHSNSWGDDGTDTYTTWCAIIDEFSYAHEEDLVAFAVSNAGTVRTPENAKNVLAVAATWRYPNQHLHFSGGTGPTVDGRRRPEIHAAGQNVFSSAPLSCNMTTMSGTSQACPAVAGAAALVRQYFREGYYPDGAPSEASVTPSGALLKAVLLNGTVDMSGVGGYPSNIEGWGRLVLDNALHFAGEPRRLIVRDVRNADGLTTGQVERLHFTVESSAESLRVTMVFTDPPAAVGVADPVINDLDLVVIGPEGIPGGNVFRGNWFSGGQSVADGDADSRNNGEQVYLLSPTVGEYTVEIHATAVHGFDPQGFAVVVTGDVRESLLGDADGDGDVDLADFARLQVCYTGEGLAFADEACGAFDEDGDGDVDSLDLAAFEARLVGPGAGQ
jgi:hypothetical protein